MRQGRFCFWRVCSYCRMHYFRRWRHVQRSGQLHGCILVGDFSGRLCGDGFSSDCIKCNFSDDRYEVGDFQLCIGDDFVVAWCVYFDSLLGKDGTGPQDCDLLFESDRKQATQSGGVLVFTDCDFVDRFCQMQWYARRSHRLQYRCSIMLVRKMWQKAGSPLKFCLRLHMELA